MFQLKFNSDFNEIVRDIPRWQKIEDIPKSILDFIHHISKRRVIYVEENKKFYCGKCTQELEDSGFCAKCQIQHEKYTIEDVQKRNINIQYIWKNFSSAILDFHSSFSYYAFDIQEKNVYLYQILEKVTYDHPLSLLPHQNSSLSIMHCYLVEKDGITDLDTNQWISFSFLEKCNQELEKDASSFFQKMEKTSQLDSFEQLVLSVEEGYFYPDNLEELKTTVYQYSKIWKLKDFLIKQHSFSIAQLTFNPLYHPQFEYLVNDQLYCLAWSNPQSFSKGKNFQEIFQVDKKYYPLMVKYDINFQELRVLQISPTTDIEVLHFFEKWIEVYEDLLKELVTEIQIDLKKLKDYLFQFPSPEHTFLEYLDYFQMAKEFHLDFKDKKVLYPKNLRESHDALYHQIEVVEDPILDEKIKQLSKVLALNRYEDDTYLIYPVSSMEELVEESRQQKNCVRTYCDRIAKYQCQIYFMRKKEELERSFVTIEVFRNKIMQARVKYNESPSEEVMHILRKWEQNLISVVKES